MPLAHMIHDWYPFDVGDRSTPLADACTASELADRLAIQVAAQSVPRMGSHAVGCLRRGPYAGMMLYVWQSTSPQSRRFLDDVRGEVKSRL
jgi:hypothetical protein